MVSFLQSPDENSDHYDHSKKSRRRRRGRTFDDASIPSMHEIVRMILSLNGLTALGLIPTVREHHPARHPNPIRYPNEG